MTCRREVMSDRTAPPELHQQQQQQQEHYMINSELAGRSEFSKKN